MRLSSRFKLEAPHLSPDKSLLTALQTGAFTQAPISWQEWQQRFRRFLHLGCAQLGGLERPPAMTYAVIGLRGGPVPARLSSALGGELISHSLAALLGMRTDEHCPYLYSWRALEHSARTGTWTSTLTTRTSTASRVSLAPSVRVSVQFLVYLTTLTISFTVQQLHHPIQDTPLCRI